MFSVVGTIGKHRTARNEYRRYVQTNCRQEHTGDDFVAVRYKYKPVESMSHSHTFDAVGDYLTGGKGIFHSLVSHCDTVANAYCIKFNRSCAGSKYTVFNGTCYSVQMNVSRYNFIERIYNAYNRTADLLIGQSESL